jgi:hypothetical protein
VLADSLPTALLASMALTTVRTSTAHLAVRALLHPVLARPLCGRGSLPLRALRRRLFSPLLVDIGTVDIRNWDPHLRTPNRRRHPSFARPTSAVDQKTGSKTKLVHPRSIGGSNTANP